MKKAILFAAFTLAITLTSQVEATAQKKSPNSSRTLSEVTVPLSVQNAFFDYIEATYPSYQYYSGGWTKSNGEWVADYIVTTQDGRFCYGNNSVKPNGEITDNGGYCVLAND